MATSFGSEKPIEIQVGDVRSRHVASHDEEQRTQVRDRGGQARWLREFGEARRAAPDPDA